MCSTEEKEKNFWKSWHFVFYGDKSPNLIGVGNHLFCCLFRLSPDVYNDLIFAFDGTELRFFLATETGKKPEGGVMGKTGDDFVLFFYEDAHSLSLSLSVVSDGFRFRMVYIFSCVYVYNIVVF